MRKYGLTDKGICIKTFDDIRQQLDDDVRRDVNRKLSLGYDTPLGYTNANVAAALAELWQLTQAVYASRFPSSASGQSLDAAVELLGLRRQKAAHSKVELLVTVAPGTTLKPGLIVRSTYNGARFETSTAVENQSPHERTAEIDAKSVETGPIVAPSHTVTEIETRINGWISVTNPAPAIKGRNRETRDELRARFYESTQHVGSSTPRAIRAALRNIKGVREAVIQEGVTDPENPDALPGRLFLAIVDGGDEQQIAQVLAERRGLCSYPIGDIKIDVLLPGDTQAQTMRFSRPTYSHAVIEIGLWVNEHFAGSSAIHAALRAYFESIPMGGHISRFRINEHCMQVRGVVDINPDLFAFSLDGAARTLPLQLPISHIAVLDPDPGHHTITTNQVVR